MILHTVCISYILCCYFSKNIIFMHKYIWFVMSSKIHFYNKAGKNFVMYSITKTKLEN